MAYTLNLLALNRYPVYSVALLLTGRRAAGRRG